MANKRYYGLQEKREGKWVFITESVYYLDDARRVWQSFLLEYALGRCENARRLHPVARHNILMLGN